MKFRRIQPSRKAKREKRLFEVPKKRQKIQVEITKFEDLPNEIILKIFKYLEIADLLQCTAVNERIREIANCESLWEIVHLSGDVRGKYILFKIENRIETFPWIVNL